MRERVRDVVVIIDRMEQTAGVETFRLGVNLIIIGVIYFDRQTKLRASIVRIFALRTMARVKKTSLGESLAGSYAYNPIRESRRESRIGLYA